MSATIELAGQNGASRLMLRGDWTVWTASEAAEQIARVVAPEVSALDLSNVGAVDTAGAYLMLRLKRNFPRAVFEGGSEGLRRLIAAAEVAEREGEEHPPHPAHRDVKDTLERIGRGVEGIVGAGAATLSFFGETLVTLFRLARHPARIRWVSIAAVAEQAGLDALPIIAVLSFFVGLVLAYVGVSTLSDFGLEVFTVEAVGVGVLREFAVVITAVLLAGRTNSAFTAEIGAMRMRQEIDAMRTLGLDVMERLVAPRVIAMVAATPLLTLVAMFAGLAGGLLVAWVNLGVTPSFFFTRLDDNVPAENFWIGMIKAPVFGLVLAVVACRHGLRVGGDVASLGRETTASVVEAIFLIIVIDALFAIYFLELGW